MAQTDYDTPATPAAERLVKDLFALGGVGYVALGAEQEVLLRRLPPAALGASAESDFYDDLIASTSDSNFYEELLVNPTLLKLAGQRGGLDCGGVRYIAIGYGGFVQLILPMKDGHISLGIAETSETPSLAERAQAVLSRHGRASRRPKPSLLASAARRR